MSRKKSAWTIEPAEGVINPGSEIVIKAICLLHDKTKYEDTINIEIENSHTQKISVRAQGGGSSIVSKPDIGNLVDFGTYFSGGIVKRTFTLTNMSSRQQNLSFQPDVPNTSTKKESLRDKVKNLPSTLFKITPPRVELNPGDTKEIVIEGFGEKPQLVEEGFVCNAIIGKTSGKDKIMKFKIRCEFVAPLVSFSTKDLVFRCEHDGVSLPKSQTKILTISNVSTLDLTAQLTTSAPFSLVEEDTGNLVRELMLNLKTGESIHLGINFNTTFKKDSHNEVSNGLLTICYSEHQHNDLINLTGEIYFPNIHLETSIIDFGCILNNTEVSRTVKMTNIGPLIVNYKWKFILEKDNVISNLPLAGLITQRSIKEHQSINMDNEENEEINNQLEKQETSNEMNHEASTILVESHLANMDQSQLKKSSNKLEELLLKNTEFELPSIEEIFDITPLFGSLHPGETQDLVITYFGHKEIKASVKAVCEIRNGPQYEMYLKGEASVLNYELSNRIINLGSVVC